MQLPSTNNRIGVNRVSKSKDNAQKRCPKCGGANICLDSDYYGWFEHCLSCGYTKDLEVVSEQKNSPMPVESNVRS